MLSSRALGALPRHSRNLRRLRGLTLALAALAVSAACGGSRQASPLDRLRPCTSDEGPVDAYCGRLLVFEDRAAAAGRRIPLNIVVLPSLGNDHGDPLF